ncbi:hypothetical protein ACHHYP_15630 [Achlya hypogyna]|uniref:Uncharacterized protein n=1 Tax=Achlya hypogyna TaxID=1202772 RepID=A0A1V9YAF9_ACHHY|nr:hypothetical protein ACHHYP_15630 [Achlya hypogyna]
MTARDLRSYMRETTSSRVKTAPVRPDFLRKHQSMRTQQGKDKSSPAPAPMRWRSANAHTMGPGRAVSLPTPSAATATQSTVAAPLRTPPKPVRSRGELLKEFQEARSAFTTGQKEWLDRLSQLMAELDSPEDSCDNNNAPESPGTQPTTGELQAFYEAAMVDLQNQVRTLTTKLSVVRAECARELAAETEARERSRREKDEEKERAARRDLESEIQSLLDENRSLQGENETIGQALEDARAQLSRLEQLAPITEGHEDDDIAALRKDNEELRTLLQLANSNISRDEETIMRLKRQLAIAKNAPETSRKSNQEDALLPVLPPQRRAKLSKTTPTKRLLFG